MYNHALSEYFDFAQTCERADGSRYGTAGQCRKGTEVSPDEIKSQIDKRNREIEFQLGGTKLSKKAIKELETAKRSGELSNPLSATESEVNLAQAKLKGQTEAILKDMNRNEVDADLVKDFVRNRQFMGDVNTATTIIVGMEDTIPTGADVNRYYAEKFAYHKLAKENPEQKQAITEALAKETVDYKLSQYSSYQSKAITKLNGSVTSAVEIERAIGGVAQLELRSMPANRLSTWDAGELSWVKSSTKISSVIGSRDAYEKNDEAMFKNFSNQLIKAAKNNPNLKNVTLGTGNDKVNAKVIKELENNGAKSHSFIFFAKGNPQIGRIVDLDGTGKAFAYDFGMSVSSKEFQQANFGAEYYHPKNSKGWYEIMSKYIQERRKLLAGKAKSYEEIVATKSTIIRAKDLNRGRGGTSLPNNESERSKVKTSLIKKALRTRTDLSKGQRIKLQDEIARREGRITSKEKEAKKREEERNAKKVKGEEKKRAKEAQRKEQINRREARERGRPSKSNQQKPTTGDNRLVGKEGQLKLAQALISMNQGRPKGQLKEMLAKNRIPNDIVSELLK